MKRTQIMRIITFLITSGLILLVLYYVIQQKFELQRKEIKIGVIASLTGLGSYMGEQQMKGIRLALDNINTHGGINGSKLSIVVEDSMSDSKGVIAAAQKLIDIEKTHYILGDSWNSTTATLVPLTNKKKIITISPVTSLDSLDADDYFFRTISPSRDMMDAIAQYAAQKMNLKKVAIIRVDTSYNVENARDFTDSFVKYGGSIVIDEKFSPNVTDYRSHLLKIKKTMPEAILNLHAPGPVYGILLQQAKEIDLNVRWLGHMSAENGEFLKVYAPLAEGLVYPYPYNSSDQYTQGFVREVQKQYYTSPDFVIANAYDATMLMADAIKNAGDNTDVAKKYLLSISDYQGVSGKLSFDANGNAKRSIIIKTIKEGKFIITE